jgi:predicted PurR-regulated permease PerM
LKSSSKYDKNFYIILSFILSFLIGTLIFIFIVFKSFFWSAFISLIFYIGSRDYYLRIKKRLPSSISILAPWIMILLILFTIVLPLSIIVSNLLKEILSLLFVLKVNLSEDKLLPFLMNFSLITDYFTDNEFFWVQLPTIYREIVGSYGDVLNIDSLYGILSNATGLIMGGLKIPLDLIINSLFTFMLLFFFYKDGYKVEQFIVSHLPLSSEIKQKIAYRILDAVKTVLKGNAVISVLQGIVLGLILFFSGISNFILYAFIGSFFSLIPVVGTAIIWLPAGLYIYFYEGNILNSILLMSLSFTSYLVLENFLKPAILDKKLNIHPFILFLSLLGGIQEFGIIGLIIGPVTITIIVILYDFWSFYRNGLEYAGQDQNK